jgi:hypothetical protein
VINELTKSKCWNEFVEWMDKQGFYLMPKEIHISKEHRFMNKEFAYMISDRELQSLLVEFCDSKGRYIVPDIVGGWWYSISDKEGDVSFTTPDTDKFTTRAEATEQAIIKCFELMGEGK